MDKEEYVTIGEEIERAKRGEYDHERTQSCIVGECSKCFAIMLARWYGNKSIRLKQMNNVFAESIMAQLEQFYERTPDIWDCGLYEITFEINQRHIGHDSYSVSVKPKLIIKKE